MDALCRGGVLSRGAWGLGAADRAGTASAGMSKTRSPGSSCIGGSSGKGGRLRTACRTWLRQQELCFLPGEEFSIFNQEALRWLALCPRLRQDRDLDAENRGVTYVLLK